MNYYERHLGDYARDTAHLSLLEHGAYTLLLDRYYATEQPIPADQVHRIARTRTAQERAAVNAVLAEFFTLDNGLYSQKRVQSEIERAHIRIETARSNGRSGGRPRKNPTETQRVPGGLLLGSKTETQSKALHTPYSRLQSPDSSIRSSERASNPASHEVWREHYDWFLATIRPAYPSKLHTDAQWFTTGRIVAGWLSEGSVTRDDLLRLTMAFAAQQDAKGNRDSQYVAKPSVHFGWQGEWRGPFPLPAESATEESAMDRIRRLNSGDSHG